MVSLEARLKWALFLPVAALGGHECAKKTSLVLFGSVSSSTEMSEKSPTSSSLMELGLGSDELNRTLSTLLEAPKCF